MEGMPGEEGVSYRAIESLFDMAAERRPDSEFKFRVRAAREGVSFR
jgi:hypothetical protein